MFLRVPYFRKLPYLQDMLRTCDGSLTHAAQVYYGVPRRYQVMSTRSEVTSEQVEVAVLARCFANPHHLTHLI